MHWAQGMSWSMGEVGLGVVDMGISVMRCGGEVQWVMIWGYLFGRSERCLVRGISLRGGLCR